MEEEKIVNLGGVNRPIPSPGILQNPGNQVPGNSPSPRDMFLGIMKQNQSTSLPNIPVSSFYTGNRYEQTRPFTDYEEMAAQQQSGFEQFRNGIGKMVGLAGTSFISGTAGFLYGIGSAASTLKFSNLYNNPVTQMMDQAQSGMEDYLPNYYKKSEQDAEWWSPDNWYTANFWGDKVFKNIGYGIGSIAGGAAWTKVFKLIGQTNSLVRAGKGLEASANIEKAMGIVPKTQKLSAIESTLANLSQGARDIIKNNGDRFLTSAMGTFGEASIEALQKMNEFRNSAIEEYKNEFGYAPQGEDLNDINEFAEKAGNYVWGMNTVLLTGSNYFQLPKILGSSRKVEKAFINKLTQEGLGKEFIEKTAKTRFGKLLDTTTGLSRFLISPIEAAEEGLQFSVATGVDDYFDRAYKNKEELGSFLETVYGAMGNVFGEGIEKTLTTKEGIESLIIGSLAGGIQQAPMSIYTEGLTGRGGQRKRNTDIALKKLNETNIQAALKDQADFMAIGVGSQAMRQQAIENNDVLSEKDYEKDFTLSYLMPRAKYGKMDSVYNELDYYKQQALSGGFEELQSAGIAFDGETKEQFVQRIGNLENTAKSLNKHYDNINLNYAGILLTDKNGNVVNDEKGNPLRKYAPVVVDKLVYAASKIDDYSARIPGVNAELAAAGIPTVNILQNILENGKPNKESVKEALDQINAMDVTNDTKDDLKRSLSDLIELSLRRKLFINQYNGIKEKPLNYTYFSASEKVREMGSVELTQKEGKKNVTKSFEVGKEYSLDEPIRLENGKLVLAPKLTILSQTLGGEFEVRLPDGREVFLSPIEFKAYGLTEEDNASPEFEKALDQAIDEVLSLPEYKDIPKTPGMSKYQFINSIGDEKLLKDILKRFNDIAKVVIEEKKDVKRAEEEIKKNKKEIIKQIDDVIPGEEVETFPPTLEELEKKASDDTGELGYLPSADKFFIRSTTASEDVTYEGYDPNPDPHIVRSRIFLNNVRKFSNNDNILAIPFTVKQSESIPGLDKLVRLSYGISEEEYNSEGFDKKAFDAKIKDVATGFVGMLFVEQDPVTKEMFYIDQDGNRINKLGEEIDLSKVIFQTMPTTEVKYSDGSDRYRGPEKPQFLANAVAWGAARKKMFDDSSVSAYKFEVSRGVPVVEPNVEGRMNEFAVGGGHLATDDEVYSMKGLIEVVTKGFVAFQGQSIKMRKGTTVLKNKDVLVYLNNAKFGRKKAQSIYRVMKALVDEMVQSGKAGKAINLNKQYIAFLKSVMFYKAGETQSKGRFFIDLDNMNFVIGNTSYPIRDFATYEKVIIDELTDTYHSISKETLTKFFEEPFYEFYYENGSLKEREWLNYQTYLLSGKDRSVDDIPLVTTVAKPSEGNPNSFLSKYAVLADFNLGAQRVKSSDKKQKEPKLPKDKKTREEEKKEVVKKPEGYNYEGKLNTYKASFGDVKFTATKDADNNVNVNVNFDENVPTFQNFKNDELAKAKERVVSAQMIEEDETSKNTIVAAYTTLVLDTLLSKEEKEKAKAPAAPASPVSELEAKKAGIEKRRQETLKSVSGSASQMKVYVPDGENRDLTNEEQQEVENFINQLIEKNKTAQQIIDYLTKQGYIRAVSVSTFDQISYIQGRIDGTITTPVNSYSIIKDINAKYDAELAALEGTSSSDLENKIKSLSNSVYSDSNNLGLFLDVLLDTTKDYKAGADINQEGFVVNFSGVESKDDINLTINNLSKEGDNYRIIGKGGKGSKAASYNFLVSPSGEVLSITSKEGKTFSGETYTNVSPTEKLRNSIQSTSNKDLMIRLAALADADELTIESEVGISIEQSDDVLNQYSNSEIAKIIRNTNNEAENFLGKLLSKKEEVVDGGKAEQEIYEFATIQRIFANDGSKIQRLIDHKGKVRGIPLILLSMNAKEAGLLFDGKQNFSLTEKQISDFFNSKFNLKQEIASLEAPTPIEKPAPPSGKTFKKKDDPLFREVGKLDVERITPEDIEEFKKWHAEKVPFIPYEILEQIYKSLDGVRAWGVFEEGFVKFYKGAQRGTEYHEIFEAIWASFLTPAEREAILKQERNKGGYFVDRASRKEILYLDATEKQIKERIADDFADFRLGKLPARNLSERIQRFFKAIVDFFKSFIQKPSLKEELFKAIDSGKFKESRIPEQVKVLAPEYRAIPGIDETAANLIVEDMISETARFLFGEDKSLLYNTKELTGSQVYNNLLDIYSEPDNNRLEVIGEEAFDDLYERMRGFFYSLGVTIPVNEAIEINEGDVTNRNYAPEPFETDWKKNARFAIKFAIATLIKRKDQGQADVSTIELKGNTLQGYQLTPFGRTFSDLLKTLSNSSIEQFAQKIIKKSASNPTYKGLMNRLGGDATNGYFPFEKFKTDDWRFYIQFFQTFAKQKPEIIIQYMDGGLVYSAEADNFSSTNILVKDWIESMKQLAKDKSSIIKYNRVNKTYKIDTSSKDYPDSLPKNAVEQIEYLEKLGIDFPIEIYRLLKDTPQPGQNASDKDQFIDAVSTIYEYLQKTEELGSLSTSVLDVNSSYMTLARLYSKVTSIEESNVLTNVKGKMMQKYTENNYTSVFENEFNSSKDLAELMSKFPQLNDTYSKNSLVLKQGGKFFNPSGKKTKDLKVKVIQGVIDLQEGKGSEISELSIGQRFSLEINQNLKGNYYIFVPADSSTEWMLNVGNEISFEDSSSDRGWNKTYSIFKGYLEDEINLALDYVNREELKNTRPDAKKLRMFADILPESVVNEVHQMIEKNSSTEDILNYVIDKKDANDNSVFELSIFYMINSDVDTTLETLINNGELVSIPTEEGAEPSYKWSSLEISDESKIKQNFYDKNNLSETQVREILTFANINYAIANIEMHKLLFGDPYQFKSSEDEVKRIKSFLSPRRTTFDSIELNNKLNKVGNTVNDVVIPVGDLFNYQFKDHIDTVSLADVEIFSKAYPGVKINETDGFSIIIDGAFREVKIKNAEWSDQAEAWYQWQTAYARRELSNKGLYSYPEGSNALKNADERTLKNPEPDYKLEVLKPIVSGVKYNSNTIELVLDKMSQMPIFYKAVEGTAMEELYLQMLQNKIGYVAYNSARKEGVRDLHELYDVEKSFNKAGFTPLTIEKVSWKSYGIQVSNLYQDDKHQTRGSQITKIVSMDMFADGKEVMKGAKDLYDRNVEMLDKLHENAYNTLLEKLGIVDTGIDFVAPDMVSVAELLTSEILKRDPSENLKDSLELVDGQFKLRLEASTDYRKIKDIIYSLVHKSITSPSMNGRPHVLTPVTLWENQKEGRGLIRKVGEKWVNVTRQEYDNLSDEEKRGVKLSSNKLKFYTEDQPYIEVMIPYFFKEKMVGVNKKFKNDQELLKYLNDTEEGRSILTGVGFRIPTQAMSSSEVFKVKGFLHPSMGYTVVVPSEITHKAGSDFDIDKLNMYLKSIYIDEEGNPRLVTYKGSEEATKEFYSKLYDNSVKAKLDKLMRSEKFKKNTLELFSYSLISEDAETRPIVEYAAEMPSELIEFLMDNEDVISEIEEQAFELEMNQYDYFKQQVDRSEKLKGKLSDVELQKYLKDEYVKRMYKKSLENEYYDTMVKMIQLPDNYKRLLFPVGKANLDNVAKDIRDLMGDNTDLVKNKLINRNYLTKIRQAFVMGKKWVGIAAVNITGHSLAQKANLFLDTRRLKNVDAYSRSFLGNLSTFLPHNTIMVDGKEMISLAGRATADGKNEFISDRLSGYATGFVDVSKDPYIMDIIRSNSVVGTAMFLERIGVGEATPYFLNQPIIIDYLTYLNSIQAKGLFSKKNLEAVLNRFITSDEALAFAKENAKNKTIDTSINHLRENISKFKTNKGVMSVEFNAEQRVIFMEFLKLAKMGQEVFTFTQGYNYDTTRFRNSDSFERKVVRTVKARTNNIINSIDSIFENSFIGNQKDFVDKSMNAMGAIFKLEHPKFRYVKDEVMKSYREDDYLSQDDYDTIAEKVGASYFDFIVQTNSDIQAELQELTTGDNSVASQLSKIKLKHPNVKLLSELTTESSFRPGGAETIRLKVKPDLSTEVNSYIGMMRELKQLEPEFYNRLVKLAIIQGSYPSYVTILQIVPQEDYAAIVNPIIEKLAPSNALDVFYQEALFQRQNWKDEVAVPTVKKYNYKQKVDIYSDEVTYSTEMFGSIPGEPISRRQILLLNPNYNLSDEVVKIPRVVKASIRKNKNTPEGKVTFQENVMIDISKNKPVSTADIAKSRAKGMFLYDVYYGYKKVRYSDGSPLIDQDGNHVYKRINLYGDGVFASEYRTDREASIFNNGTAPATYEFTKKTVLERPDGTRELIKTVEVVQELEDAQVIAAYGMDMVEEEQVVYSMLGSKTRSANVVIKPWNELKNATRVITPEGIVSTRVKDNDTAHFGNPFTHDKKLIDKGAKLILTNSTRESVQRYIKWILTGEVGEYFFDPTMPDPADLDMRREWILEELQSGEHKGKSILYYAELGQPSHATALDYLINEYDWSEQIVPTEVVEEAPTKSELSGMPKGFVAVSPEYGVYKSDRSLTVEQTERYINLLRPQAEVQTYKENKGRNANMMFNYGLRWGRRAGNPDTGIPKMFSIVKNNPADGGTYYGYDRKDQNGNDLPSLEALQPIMNEITQRTGIDMSNYDSVIANIYLEGEYIYPHRDTTEDKSAKEYPVVVYTLGNDAALGIWDYNKGGVTFANTYDSRYAPDNLKGLAPTNEILTRNGSIYTFGLEGKGRFTLVHATPDVTSKPIKYPPIKLPNGKTISNYTITLTFRRAQATDIPSPTNYKVQEPSLINQKAKQPSRKKTKQTNQLSLFGDETGAAPRSIKVDQYQITVQPDGQMFFANGTEVTDQTIKNKVDIQIAIEDKTLKISTYNKNKYFVLSDDRILGSGKTNLGKETVTDPDIRKKIIMTAVLYKKTC